MEATIQISEVNSKDVNTSRGASTVYSVKASDGKEFSTFKKELGHAAGALRGQYAVVEYQEVQKGKYMNLYLDAIKPAEAVTAPPAATVEVAHTPVTAATAVSHNITYKDDKSAQINRSVAFKAAVELVAAGVFTIEGVEDLDKLTGKFIPIVEGTYTAPVKADAVPLGGSTTPSSGETFGIEAKDGSLVKF